MSSLIHIGVLGFGLGFVGILPYVLTWPPPTGTVISVTGLILMAIALCTWPRKAAP